MGYRILHIPTGLYVGEFPESFLLLQKYNPNALFTKLANPWEVDSKTYTFNFKTERHIIGRKSLEKFASLTMAEFKVKAVAEANLSRLLQKHPSLHISEFIIEQYDTN